MTKLKLATGLRLIGIPTCSSTFRLSIPDSDMPLRKPLPMLAVCDEEEEESEDGSESDDAEAVQSGELSGVGVGDAAKKARSPDLGGQLAGLSLGSNAVRDAYDDPSPAGKKRGRGGIKRPTPSL